MLLAGGGIWLTKNTPGSRNNIGLVSMKARNGCPAQEFELSLPERVTVSG